MAIGLWKYNTTTGYWRQERSCEEETAQKWLDIFKKDDPAAHFKLSKSKPSGAPAKDSQSLGRRARLHAALDRVLNGKAWAK